MTYILATASYFKYPVLFILAIAEGPLVMTFSGFLITLGYLQFLPAYIVLMAGDLVGDIGWYGIGYYWGERFVRRFGKYFSVTENHIAVIKKVFHRFQYSILLVSKITMGLGFALVTLITAGMVRIPFRRYVLLNFFGQFVWTGLLISLGYLLGNLYIVLNKDLKLATLIAAVIIFLLALSGFSKFIRNKIMTWYDK